MGESLEFTVIGSNLSKSDRLMAVRDGCNSIADRLTDDAINEDTINESADAHEASNQEASLAQNNVPNNVLRDLGYKISDKKHTYLEIELT